ncbi:MULTISPECIES: NAD(P)-dependent oxidoreductase [unclassified Arenibacter]|uniref:NAD-dependent epimerase/dehydratase family protein n=1 Tax=unclassified Arenibacter TaxID=2615047 RepID=UPI000E3410DE|nr:MULTISPECIES: NAD(P)-dependent oxidoreductase [unclassified Arenibacter]MCM4163645.1 epimerase [Arenibacter sp. A80]RFT56372.1 NAD(P)-dependent oxidoreductase [Arenibacter sp. P308M17]
MDYPKYFRDENELEEALSRPTSDLVAMFKALEGDVILLGVAGKMGVSMARMARRACNMAGIEKRIIGVSRFSDREQQSFLEESGVETIKGDLLDREFLDSLPEVDNVIYLAGTKFGTDGNESLTWAMNSFLPGLVAQKYKNSRIVAFSTGCVYPLVDITSGGSKESDTPGPVGEYAQSCLGRERLFEYGSIRNGTPVILIRLNYAVEMRYGVLVDIASKVYHQEPVDVTMGYANVIWQGDANEMILRSLQFCASPAAHLNISGTQLISVAEVAKKFGQLMGKEVLFRGTEADSALSVNVSKSIGLLGAPKVALDQLVEWTAHWIGTDKRLLGKSTHFEVRDGKY